MYASSTNLFRGLFVVAVLASAVGAVAARRIWSQADPVDPPTRPAAARMTVSREFVEPGVAPGRHDTALEMPFLPGDVVPAPAVEVAPAPRRVCRAYVTQVVPPTGLEYAETARVTRTYGHFYEVDGVRVVAHKHEIQTLESGGLKVEYRMVVVLIGDTAYAVVVELSSDFDMPVEPRAAEVAVRYYRAVGPYPGSSVGPEPLGPGGQPLR